MIRDIREEDIRACLDIYDHYILNSSATFETEELSYEEFRDRVHDTCSAYPWLVYEENGRVLGYAYLSAFNPRAAYNLTADIAVYVDPGHLAKGIGSKLMKALIHLAKRDGYRNIISIITEGNEASIALHERNGFIHKAFFERVGYKNGKVLGVHFYILPLEGDSFDGTPLNLKYE